MNMKKLIVTKLVLAFIIIAYGTIACYPVLQNPTPIVIVVTATPEADTPVPRPTSTFYPTPTLQPSPVPLTITDVEKALLDNGYSRAPFDDLAYGSGYSWTKGNVYEQIYTWESGAIRLEILDSRTPKARSDHMDIKLQFLDSLFSTKFMTELRQQNDTYNQSTEPSVSGDPAYIAPRALGDEWKTVYAQYDVVNTTIESLPVTFSLWFWQVTCPPQYSYCYRPNFPGQEFVGQSSLVFYTILIQLSPTFPGNTVNNG
jgi:hypothetical protein